MHGTGWGSIIEHGRLTYTVRREHVNDVGEAPFDLFDNDVLEPVDDQCDVPCV